MVRVTLELVPVLVLDVAVGVLLVAVDDDVAVELEVNVVTDDAVVVSRHTPSPRR